MKPIGHIHTVYNTKFGVPRQAGVINSDASMIVFEKEFSHPDAFRGLEEFSHVWVLWEFSECKGKEFSLTVRPPRLGGNKRVGVFASRSPFRPNSIGLSCVKLEKIATNDEHGVVLYVSGADMMDGTPVYDIKPYLPYTDSHPDALSGYTKNLSDKILKVNISDELLSFIPDNMKDVVLDILSHDPRPSYQDDGRIYGMDLAGFNIKFSVKDGVLTVVSINKINL